MIRLFSKRKSLKQRVRDLELVCKKQAQDIEILNAKVGDIPIQVEVVNANSVAAQQAKEAENRQAEFDKNYEDLIAQY